MQYKYKVCKGQKVLALSTTLREAEDEARRVGGEVVAIGQKNPAGILNILEELDQGDRVKAKVAKAKAKAKAKPKAASEPVLLEYGQTLYMSLLENMLNGPLADLYNKYKKMSAEKIAAKYSIAQEARSILIEQGYAGSTGYYAEVLKPITFSTIKAAVQQALEKNLASISPKRIKKERVRIATTKAAVEKMSADKQAHEAADKFPLRPTGVKGPFEAPQDAEVSPPDKNYIATLLAPKCLAPVAYFHRNRDVYGYSPDLTRYYTRGYFDGSEESEAGYPRVHMSGLEDTYADTGKGIGPAAYMIMPIAAVAKFRSEGTVYSPEVRGGPRDYCYRTEEADRAWANLIKHGIAYQETESGSEYTSETFDVEDYFQAGEGVLDDWTDVEDVDPSYVTVTGTKEGGEMIIDVMTVRAVLMDQIALHIDDDLMNRIEREGSVNLQRDAISPPAASWAKIDMLHCTPDEVVQMVEFCSTHAGMEADDYLREVAGVIGTNPTYRKGTLDEMFSQKGIEIKTQNPRRKNPAAESWLARHQQADWDTPDANKQDTGKPEPKHPPKGKSKAKNPRKAKAKSKKRNPTKAASITNMPPDTPLGTRWTTTDLEDVLEAYYKPVVAQAKAAGATLTDLTLSVIHKLQMLGLVLSTQGAGGYWRTTLPEFHGRDLTQAVELVAADMGPRKPAAPKAAPAARHPKDSVVLPRGRYGWLSSLYNPLADKDMLAEWPNEHYPNSDDFVPVRDKLLEQNLLDGNLEAARELYLSDVIKAAQRAGIPLQNLPAWYKPAADQWVADPTYATAAAMARPKAAPAPAAAPDDYLRTLFPSKAAPAARATRVDELPDRVLQNLHRFFGTAVRGSDDAYDPDSSVDFHLAATVQRMFDQTPHDRSIAFLIYALESLGSEKAGRSTRSISYLEIYLALRLIGALTDDGEDLRPFGMCNFAKMRADAQSLPPSSNPVEYLKGAVLAEDRAKGRSIAKPSKPMRQRRTAADSAALFPKRCVGESYSYKIDKPQTPVVTIISPLCKQPMVVTSYVDSYSGKLKHWLSAPDKSVVYAGGYEGGDYEDKYIDGANYARQHMLPGVLSYNDRGKGCGPAAYMAGPFVARRRNAKFAGVWSEFGGRSEDAEAAWLNLIAHKTAEIRNERDRKETTLKLLPVMSYAARVSAGGVPSGYALAVQPTQANVTTIRSGDTVITLKHMLEIGFVLDMAPEVENTLPDVNRPFVPSPEIWKELDLSATDDASLEKMLKFCASRYAKHGGNIAEGDYLYAAALNVAENPSLLMHPEEAAEWAKTFAAKPKGSKAKPKASRAKKQNPASDLSAFLNDESWAEYGGVKNPRKR